MRKSGTRGRRPLSKAQLLPLAADLVSRVSLKHHLALTCLVAGQGDLESLSTLTNVVEIVHYLDPTDVELIRRADDALVACIERAKRSETFTLTDTERDEIAALLLYHDAQLVRVPMHRYIDALECAIARDRQRAD
ncbi:hypothetical protein [Burkholderia cepacia]|uniref:hypothetical protein n=1 Tax=Burkholderia cepacia TaxID=292 RepID=UPI0015892451|nr:hypothetical protein [Burkholderia cepacia]